MVNINLYFEHNVNVSDQNIPTDRNINGSQYQQHLRENGSGIQRETMKFEEIYIATRRNIIEGHTLNSLVLNSFLLIIL